MILIAHRIVRMYKNFNWSYGQNGHKTGPRWISPVCASHTVIHLAEEYGVNKSELSASRGQEWRDQSWHFHLRDTSSVCSTCVRILFRFVLEWSHFRALTTKTTRWKVKCQREINLVGTVTVCTPLRKQGLFESSLNAERGSCISFGCEQPPTRLAFFTRSHWNNEPYNYAKWVHPQFSRRCSQVAKFIKQGQFPARIGRHCSRVTRMLDKLADRWAAISWTFTTTKGG